MTTKLDQRLVPRIKKLIAKLGKTVTFRVVTGAAVGQLDGTASAGATTEYSVKVTPPGPPEGSRASHAEELASGEGGVTGAVEVMVAAEGLPFTPAIGMVVEIDGRDWLVSALDPVHTGDQIGGWVLLLTHG